jgi:hypothetical protein
MAETQKNKKDRTGIMFGFTVLTIAAIILFMVITAFASTEAGPAEGGDAGTAVIQGGGAGLAHGADVGVQSTEAGPTEAAAALTDEQKKTLFKYLNEIVGKTKTGEVEAGTSTCAVTFYRKKLFGLIPRQTTHTLHYRGVDFSKVTVENLHKAFAKTTEMDCGGCEKQILKEWQDDIVALKVRCPLKDGEWDFAIRKN